MKKLFLVLCLVLTFSISTNAQSQSPASSEILKTSLGGYSSTEYHLELMAYKAALDATDSEHLGRAKRIRGEITWHVLRAFDYEHVIFIDKLTKENSTREFLFDLGENGLVAAIGFGAPAKTFAAISQLVTGTRNGYKKNFLNGQTMALIIAAMETNRTNQLTIIQNNLVMDVNDYPLDAALFDAVKYWRYGTIQSGLQSLTESAGSALQNAKQNAESSSAARASDKAMQMRTKQQ